MSIWIRIVLGDESIMMNRCYGFWWGFRINNIDDDDDKGGGEVVVVIIVVIYLCRSRVSRVLYFFLFCFFVIVNVCLK